MRRSAASLCLTPLLVAGGYPVESLTPDFIWRLLNITKADSGGHITPSAEPRGVGGEWAEWVMGQWPKRSLPAVAPAAAPEASTTTSSTTTLPASASEAAREFKKLYKGSERWVPSWEDTLAKLRCDVVHSFSSCAQHCFSLLPDFSNLNQSGDISSELIPRSTERAWWRPSIALKKQGEEEHDRLFGMSPSDQREFKSCLLNVCVHGYIIADQLPGCLNADGIVSNTASTSSRQPKADYDDLDFYEPHRAEMYRRFGFFTFNRLIQSLLPECDLSTAKGCDFENGSLLRLALFVVMFGTPVVLALLIAPFVTSGLRPNPSGSTGGGASIRDSPIWPVLMRALVVVNKWFVNAERVASRWWRQGHALITAPERQAGVTAEYELIGKLTSE